MQRIITTFISFFLVSSLSACVNDTFLNQQDQQNRDTCIQAAKASNENWKHESLDQIYETSPKITKDEKSFFFTIHQVFRVCETLLSPENYYGHPTHTPDIISKWAAESASPFEGYEEAMSSMQLLDEKIVDTYAGAERKLFLSRTGGRRLCNKSSNDTDGLLLDFFYSPTTVPSSQCVYMQTKNNIPLIASQVTPDGVLATASCDTTIHIST